MHPYTLLTAGALLVAARLLFGLYRTFSSPLRSVPGPFLARFTDLWYLWHIYKGGFEHDNLALHRKYGPIVRYGPNRYSFAHPEATRAIYGHGTALTKSAWYDTWGDPNRNAWSLFSDRDISRHGANRRQYQSTYSMSTLLHYEAHVDECADIFRQRLLELSAAPGADGSAVVDMGNWFQYYAFDVIGMITYSKRLGFLDRGQDVGEIIKNLENHLGYATLVGVYPSLHQYLAPLRSRLNRKKGSGRAYILGFTQERLAEHQSKPKAVIPRMENPSDDGSSVDDFLSKFLAKHADNPAGFTQYHVLAGCVSNMVAGSDTTAISLSSILYYLLRSPHALKALRDEVDTFYREQDRVAGRVTFTESQQMPYLQAVLKEALRMHPATGLPLERVVPEGGATICDRFFPEGTIVGVNSWVEHRDRSIFGHDADEFKPERWLVGSSEQLAVMNRHWMPFGMGSRTCIGRHISTLEMSKLIPQIIHDFDFELYDNRGWKTRNWWFVKAMGFKVRVKARGTNKR